MSNKSIDFTQLYAQIQQATLQASDRPVILGGEFAANRLQTFLKEWETQKSWQGMPYRIWEHVSHIEFAAQPPNLTYLQRADIFGESGHLSLRRDVQCWLWHYIGQPVTLTAFQLEDFWRHHPNCQLRRYAESVILWGDRKDPSSPWHDDRVAAANLTYPIDTTGRVYLHFWRYTEHGQTVFVQYRGLSNRPA